MKKINQTYYQNNKKELILLVNCKTKKTTLNRIL